MSEWGCIRTPDSSISLPKVALYFLSKKLVLPVFLSFFFPLESRSEGVGRRLPTSCEILVKVIRWRQWKIDLPVLTLQDSRLEQTALSSSIPLSKRQKWRGLSEGDASLQTMPINDDVWSLSRQLYRFAARGSSRRFPPSMRESVSGARGEILATTALFTSLGKERSIRPSMQDSRCDIDATSLRTVPLASV